MDFLAVAWKSWKQLVPVIVEFRYKSSIFNSDLFVPDRLRWEVRPKVRPRCRRAAAAAAAAGRCRTASATPTCCWPSTAILDSILDSISGRSRSSSRRRTGRCWPRPWPTTTAPPRRCRDTCPAAPRWYLVLPSFFLQIFEREIQFRVTAHCFAVFAVSLLLNECLT